MVKSNDNIKFIFTFMIIVLVFFLFMYNKSFNEFFSNQQSNSIEINLNLQDNILWLNEDLDDLTQMNKGTFIYKSNNLVHSNESITKNFKYTGYVFKPDVNVKNLKIGLRSSQDVENQMSYYFDIKENNMFSLVELDREGKYSNQDINFCSIVKIEKCKDKKDIYTYNQGDMLGIVIDDNVVNYLVISKGQNDNNQLNGTIIHKSINSPVYPLNAALINNRNDNLLSESYWITSKTTGIVDKWSVEILNDEEFNEQNLPPKESLSEEETEFKVDNKVYELDGKTRIIITNHELKDYELSLTTRNNLTLNNIKYLKNILINVIFNDKILSIPYPDYKNNPNINNITIDLSRYENYFVKNKDVKVNIKLVRSLEKEENNFVSNNIKIVS